MRLMLSKLRCMADLLFDFNQIKKFESVIILEFCLILYVKSE